MLCYFLIIPVFFLILRHKHVFCQPYSFEPPNLKTVLFKEIDLMPRCWSTYEVNLLLNRRVMQDLVPRKIPRDLPLLLKYLKNLEDIVKEIPSSINQTLIMEAMGDVLGGYLQAIVVPIAKEAYYAGNVDYTTVYQLLGMLDKWKWYLSTDGGTWSQECDMRKIPTKVAALDIKVQDSPESVCQELYMSAGSNANETDDIGSETIISEYSRIAIPYFDNNMFPSAIALPFRKKNLYSLMDPNAAFILVKYYTLAMQCLGGNSNDVLAFNNFFHLWVVSKVIPHLHDQDHWYPALGGVMRVIETIKQKGLASTNPFFVQPMNEEHQDAALSANLDIDRASSLKHAGKIVSYFHIYNNPYAILIIFMIVAIIILLLCCICLCCCLKLRRRKTKPTKVSFTGDTDDNILKNAIISFYCGMKDTLARGSAESSKDKEYPPEKPFNNYNQPKAPSYPHNTPAIDTTSDQSLTISSESDDEYSTTSRE